MQKIGRIGMWFFLIFMFLFQLPSQAQNKKYFVITGNIEPEAKGSETGSIEITKNGKETSKIDIPKNGRFRFELEFFNEYNLTFKYPGHFNKIIIVSTDIPQEVWKRDNVFPPFPMVVQLLKEFEGIDKSFTLKPSGRIYYGKDIDNFEKESYFTDIQFAEQIETAKLQANQVQKEAQSISKETAQELAIKQKNFDQLIKDADALYKRGEFQMALMKYLEAKKLFPEKAYPNDRVAELQDLVKALEITEKQKAELDQKYKTAIAKANGFFDKKSYPEARPIYEEALQYKPGDVFSNGRINEIDQFLALLEKQKQYKDLVAQADKNYKSKNYDQAIAFYNQAKQAVPAEQYPQTQIDLITQEKLQQANLEQLEKDFSQTMQSANLLSQQKDYVHALDSYKKALGLKPDNKLAMDKIAEINNLLAEKKKLDDQANAELLTYNETIKNADQLFTEKSYPESLNKYKEAAKIKVDETYPAKRIKEIETILAQLVKMTQAFNKAITEANSQLTNKHYKEAKEKYQEALQYLPDSDYPKQQIAKINEVLAQQDTEAKTRQEYDVAFADGENLLKNKELAKAKDAYTKANNLIPSEPIPPKRISEINILLAEQIRKDSELKATLEAYQNAIQRADILFGNKEYTSAQLVYNEALVIKPDEKYPADQLALIEKLTKEQNEQNYKTAIAKADNSFNSNRFDESAASYNEALSFKKNDQYATKRLKEIDQKRAQSEIEKNRLRKVQEQYDAIMADAGKDFGNKDYQKSKEKYQRATGLKPDEALPKEQIAKIDRILSDLQKEDETNRQYVQLIKTAQEAFGQNKLKEARASYQSANSLKPSEPLPPKRIAEIDKMLGQLEETAKLTAMEEAQRLAKEKADRTQYENAVAAGDKSFAEKQYKTARTQYTTALNALPNEKYPRTQIAKIDDLLTQEDLKRSLALQKAQQDSIRKLAEKSFAGAMAAAKEHDQNKRYPQAIQKYQQAIQFDPSQRNKIQKLIRDIEDKIQLLAKQETEYKRIIKLADGLYAESKLNEALTEYGNAVTIKSDEEYPKNQIREIQSTLSAREQSYASAIKNGDKAFDISDWPNAKTAYTEALSIKPTEAYPLNRLKEVNQKIADSTMASISKTADMKAYDEALAKAEKALKDDQLSTAHMQFELAKTLNPDEKLPVERLKEIDVLIDKRNKDRLAQTQRDIDEKYRQAISVADNSFREKSYTIAKLQYQQALVIKPDESYPKNQMALIDKLMNEVKPVETYVNQLPETESAKPAAKPVFHQVETAQATETRAQSFTTVSDYDETLKKADDSFGIKDYSVARFFYLKASDFKPKEEYPKNQIELIRKLIDSQLSSSDISGYENAITQADAAFASKNYTIAKFFYYKALDIKSWEKYPKDRIHEILALTHSLLSEQEEKEYRDVIAKADEAYFNKDISIARFYYNKAISIKKDENYPHIKLKDIQKLIEQDKRDQENLEYRKLIEQADQALQFENFSIARFNYNKALGLKPDEKYPKDQLKRIKETLSKLYN